MSDPLVVVETHPVQYHAPIYQALHRLGIPLVALYGSDFSVAGYRDREFGTEFAWDTDLLSGYNVRFLSRVKDGGAASSDAARAYGLSRQLSDLKPAAVLLLGYTSRFDRGAILATLQARFPLFFRGETTDHARRRSWWKTLVRDQLLRSFYRRFRRLLYIGSRSLAHYQRLGCQEQQLVFSPYCVSTTPFRTGEDARELTRDQTRTNLGIRPDQIIVLYSGKLVPRKGVDMLPAAVRRLSPELSQRIVLVFLGDGELRQSLNDDAVRSPAIEVRFVGFQNQTKLSAFYHAADLLVLASRVSETWGLVVNEALHHGLPCVVSDMVGSSPDLVLAGVTGEVCRSGDVVDLAAALTRVTALVGRPAVREQCRKVVGGFSVEKAAEGIVAAFQAVAK